MLKPQSHESTPPPSSHRSSHGENRKHQEHSNNPNIKVKDPKAILKMQEQLRMEHKKKTLTPEQFEEYKRRKEREKQLYYQRKKLELQQKDKPSNGTPNPCISNKEQSQKLQGQKVNQQYKGSPAKRQKIENESRNHSNSDTKSITSDPSRKTNHDRLQTGFSTKHRPGLSSSGSDSEPHGNKLHKKPFSQLNQSKTKPNDNHHLPPPPPPSSSRNSYNNLPPPPPVATKYS